MLELLCESENQVFDYSNPASLRLLLAKTHSTEDTANKILQLLADLGTIDPELHKNKVIWSQNLVENLELVYRRRATGIPEKPVIVNNNPPSNVVSVNKSTQTKLNNTKLNNTKLEDDIIIAGKKYKKDWLQALREEFSDIYSDEELKKFADYWTDERRTLRNPKLALRNWMIKAREIKKEKHPEQDDEIEGLRIR